MRESKHIIAHAAVPDPKTESIAAHLEVRLARELNSLLKTELQGPADSAVALGSRPLSAIFSPHLPTERVSIETAGAVGSIALDGFTAWPIFITYVGGHRDPYAPIYNKRQIEERLRDFYTHDTSKIRGAIGEAIRNVGQHGHELHEVGYHLCLFAPAALFVKEIDIGSAEGPANRILMAVVADEGGGMFDPERSILNGVGSMAGVDSMGMGIELESSLLYLVKSGKGEWCLFDPTRQINPDKYDSSCGYKRRKIGEDEKIERVAALDLPSPATGCQKIMFFAHPSASAEEVNAIREQLLSALMTLSR